MKLLIVQRQIIHAIDRDYNRNCKLSALLEWMQQAADGHIARLGVSLDHFRGESAEGKKFFEATTNRMK
ncbi:MULTISPECIES: hypothetical protein [unclassified Paenibacillus]|uniref:hypothetical protein n=1 Tax=unclassified Paenibacillus TaxID=185978 RepID=UPI001C10C2E4|nr:MULTISPECIES: hypothetical protein [unclassified Paenibacillus]MBU5441101.1 hypothetical protein [Paenibacillus sp. MSJ-34]